MPLVERLELIGDFSQFGVHLLPQSFERQLLARQRGARLSRSIQVVRAFAQMNVLNWVVAQVSLDSGKVDHPGADAALLENPAPGKERGKRMFLRER